MTSFAEKYRESQELNKRRATQLFAFENTLDFEMDDFQRDACQSVESGHSVLVAAPTGAGKTLVGEFAIHLALSKGQKAFYTTPIKALSNQKYYDLVARYGAESVGLLTGDSSINSEAPVVVMTTEVLRNMLYAESSTLNNLGYVVMDEVHYLADRFRGAVWEEVIIHLPEHISVIALSATISNAEEFGAWLDTVRGKTDIIVSEHRPVPLWQHMLVGTNIVDLFGTKQKKDGSLEINPALVKLRDSRGYGGGRRRDKFKRSHGSDRRRTYSNQDGQLRGRRISRGQMVEALDSQGLLPSICFVFSRAGCDGAVSQCIDEDIRLTTEKEARTIRAYIAEATAELDTKDLKVLGFYEWREGLTRGIAAHHAGMLPIFKEVVEALFAEGLVKMVFATETLALGINMPARSVVLEKLTKFNGEAHVDISPGEYTQLTGRAGRRGIDIEGHAVVAWKPGVDPQQVSGLASKRTYPLVSSFKPTYNMSVNLLDQFGARQTQKILESSFAQFQADKSVVGVANRVRKNERALDGYAESMQCHLGDFEEYALLRRVLTEAEKNAARARRKHRSSLVMDSVHRLRGGDIVEIPQGKYRGFALVMARPESSNPRVSILTDEAQLRSLDPHVLSEPLLPTSWIKIPKKVSAKTPKERRDLASRMRNALYEGRPARKGAELIGFNTQRNEHEMRIDELKEAIKSHPCHSCSDREEHARWSDRWWKLYKDNQGLINQINRKTGTIAQVFAQLLQVLERLGYVEYLGESEYSLTPRGRVLRQIYGEKDLLTSLCVDQKIFDQLDPASLAAVVSVLVYEAKREEFGGLQRYPTPAISEALGGMHDILQDLNEIEREFRVQTTQELQYGMVWPVYKWARGKTLAQSLDRTSMAAGDFVRWVKQVIDVLDQLAHAYGDNPQMRTLCEAAIDDLKRGVVASQI